MSKSTLSIAVPEAILHPAWSAARTIEVPCRLPEAFTVRFAAKGSRWGATAYVADGKVTDVETNESVQDEAQEVVDAAWLTILAALGITGPVPPGSPLPAIALAYEAECAAYEACTNAHRKLPLPIIGGAMYWRDPSESGSHAVQMLAKYVEYVVEQACKAQTERAESKVTP